MCLLVEEWKLLLQLRWKPDAIFTGENTDVHITLSKQSHVSTIANDAANGWRANIAFTYDMQFCRLPVAASTFVPTFIPTSLLFFAFAHASM
jgi:hypothetical protein